MPVGSSQDLKSGGHTSTLQLYIIYGCFLDFSGSFFKVKCIQAPVGGSGSHLLVALGSGSLVGGGAVRGCFEALVAGEQGKLEVGKSKGS